jgi:uncharacterized protein YdeI (YjbR/CyaY-like superfamily)
MSKPAAKSFSAPLELLRSRLNWVIVRIPFDVRKAWTVRGRLKVKGEINGFPFRTSLFATPDRGHFLLINKRMQRGAKAVVGSIAKIRLEPDTDERTVTVPPELKRVLAEDRALVRWFDQLNYSTRKWITDWVTDPKGHEARQRRAEQVAEQLMSTMEAEREIPPMLRLAFAKNPLAAKGWDLMTALQRRSLLLAIFYYRNPEARARRLEKVLDLAAQVAEKKTNRP